MYSYDFEKEQEKTIYENRNVLIETLDKTYELAIIITNKNILLFNDLNKNHVLNSRGVSIQSEYVLELKLPTNSLIYTIEEGDSYIKSGERELVIYNLDISKYIEEK